MSLSTIRPRLQPLQQLEGLPLRLVALSCSNPAALAASCTAAYRTILKDEDFAVEWFLRWAPVLAPYRTLQLAAISWQQIGGPTATAEQLCHFILRCSGAQRQQLKQAAQQQEQQQQQQQQQQQAVAAQEMQPSVTDLLSTQQQSVPLPHRLPAPSAMRKARQLLQKGQPVLALRHLCLSPALLLYPYLARAGNTALLGQLIRLEPHYGPSYPESLVELSNLQGTMVGTALWAAYGAMSAGNAATLTWIMANAAAFLKVHYRLGKMFRFACRNSNRACVQQILDFTSAGAAIDDSPPLKPWHQHLAMAAARTDPWAADVVQLLLQAMPAKQLAPKYMAATYTAACQAGHRSILQQLLLHVAGKAPGWHVPVLMAAAAAAGNRTVWQQLFLTLEDASNKLCKQHPSSIRSSNGSVTEQAANPKAAGPGFSRSSSSSSAAEQQQQQQQQQEGSGSSPAATFSVSPLFGLCTPDGAALAKLLLSVLKPMCSATSTEADKASPELIIAADANRTSMADDLWQYVGRLGLQQRVAQLLGYMWSKPYDYVDQEEGFFVHEKLECMTTLNQLLSGAQPAKVAWLYQHGCLPDSGVLASTELMASAREGLNAMVSHCIKYSQHQALASLQQLCKQLQHAPALLQCMQGCMAAAVIRASRADVAALQQLEALSTYMRTLAALAHLTTGMAEAQQKEQPAASASEEVANIVSSVCLATMCLDRDSQVAELGMPMTLHLQLAAQAVVPSMVPYLQKATAAQVSAVLDVLTSLAQEAVERWYSHREQQLRQQQLRQQQSVQPHQKQQAQQQQQQPQPRRRQQPDRKTKRSQVQQQQPLEQGQDVDLAVFTARMRFVAGLQQQLRQGLQARCPMLVRSQGSADLASNVEGFLTALFLACDTSRAAAGPLDGLDAAVGPSSSSSSRNGVACSRNAVAGWAAAVTEAQAAAISVPGTGADTAAHKPLQVPTASAAAAAAAERGVAEKQQQQCRVLPLWQQAALVVAAPVIGKLREGPFSQELVMLAGVQPGAPPPATRSPPAGTVAATAAAGQVASEAPTAAGTAAGEAAAVLDQDQQEKEKGLVQFLFTKRPASDISAGMQLLRLHRHDLLAWALHSDQQQRWGYRYSLKVLIASGANTTFDPVRYIPSSQQAALVQLHERQLLEHRQLLCAGLVEVPKSPLPPFAAAVSQLTGVLLQHNQADALLSATLNDWIKGLSGRKSAAEVEKAKAVLVVAAAAPNNVLQWHKLRVRADALRQVAEVGDIDLLGMLLMVNARLCNIPGYVNPA